MASVNILYLLALVLSIVLKSIHDVDGKSDVPCFFIFGDSLVDSGNNNHLKNKGKVNYLPYGIDFPDGPTGRFNNGRTVPDVLGELMGFKSFIKSFPTAKGSQILEGVNYGSGYAGIRDETGKHMGVLVSFNKQIQHHQVTMSRIHHILGKNHSNYLKQCLYLSMIGNNDYINNYFLPKYYNSSRHYTPKQYANVLVEEYARHLKTLHDFGARKLAIIGVAPIGCTPNATAYYGTNGSLCRFTGKGQVVVREGISTPNTPYPRKAFCTTRTVATCLLHAPPPLGARGFTRRHKKSKKPRASGSASSPLHFPVGGEDPRHMQKKLCHFCADEEDAACGQLKREDLSTAGWKASSLVAERSIAEREKVDRSRICGGCCVGLLSVSYGGGCSVGKRKQNRLGKERTIVVNLTRGLSCWEG
ncbi:hypothetical protein NC651_026721 [Populus alba x Populus x berolinensis]|nr:hypothetical protein NC651_026721 [Populus alba x Populus x berolinensis]